MGTVGAQLATHSYQQSTLSPFSMNAEHVTHRYDMMWVQHYLPHSHLVA